MQREFSLAGYRRSLLSQLPGKLSACCTSCSGSLSLSIRQKVWEPPNTSQHLPCKDTLTSAIIRQSNSSPPREKSSDFPLHLPAVPFGSHFQTQTQPTLHLRADNSLWGQSCRAINVPLVFNCHCLFFSYIFRTDTHIYTLYNDITAGIQDHSRYIATFIKQYQENNNKNLLKWIWEKMWMC